MKKPDGIFKIKNVLRPNSRIVYLVYRDTMTPQEFCWCVSEARAKDICYALNSLFLPI